MVKVVNRNRETKRGLVTCVMDAYCDEAVFEENKRLCRLFSVLFFFTVRRTTNIWATDISKTFIRLVLRRGSPHLLCFIMTWVLGEGKCL